MTAWDDSGAPKCAMCSRWQAAAEAAQLGQTVAERRRGVLDEYVKKMDGIIEEVGGVTASCINPYEDLKRALQGQKWRAETAEAALLAKSAAYDALVADAEMFRWLVAEWDANGTIHATRYHPPGTAGCGLFTVSSQHVHGYGLRGAIKAAQDKAATPHHTTERSSLEG